MSIYKRAAQQRLRIETSKGPLSVEQLFDLSVSELDALAVNLEKEHKASGGKSFIFKKSTKDKTTKLKFDLVLDVLNTKMDNAEKAQKSADTKAHNQKILGLIADKKEGELAGKSIEELEEMLED